MPLIISTLELNIALKYNFILRIHENRTFYLHNIG